MIVLKFIFIMSLLSLNLQTLVSKVIYPEIVYDFEHEYNDQSIHLLLSNNNYFFAISDNEIFVKDHKEHTWKPVINQYHNINWFISHAVYYQDRIIFIVDDSLFITKDNFKGYENFSYNLTWEDKVRDIAGVAGDGNSSIFTFKSKEVHMTTNSGLNWSRIDTNIDEIFFSFLSIYINPQNNYIYLIGTLIYFISSNSGQNWLNPKDNLFRQIVYQFAFDDRGNNYALVHWNLQQNEYYYGIFKKNKHDSIYINKFKSISNKIENIKCLNGLVFASYNDILIISSDEGENWQEIQVSLFDDEDNEITDFTIIDDRLYIVSFGPYLYSISLDELISVHDKEVPKFKIYPNPATDYLNIEYVDMFKEIIITDVLSNIIHRELVFDVKVSINLQNFSNGIYNVILIGNNFSKNSHFLISK